MFDFFLDSETTQIDSKYPDDIRVIIDSNIVGKDNLISFISQGIGSPYSGDNWDGLYDALADLSWCQGRIVRIIHFELPELSIKDMSIYLSLLQSAIGVWRSSKKSNNPPTLGCLGLIVSFSNHIKQTIESFLV